MSSGVKRRYRSPQRAEQAKATRREIMEAARRLFSAVGYGRTTMEAVANEADVSVATVYLVFRTKFGLLSALVTDTAEDPALDPQEVLQATDLEQQLAVGARLIRQLHERTVAIVGTLRSGIGNDPKLEALWNDWQGRHLTAVSQVSRFLASTGRLRDGIDEAGAADVLYVLGGAETYRQFVIDRGWHPDQFEEWFADSVRRILLAEG
jgi:AcrR family transcriptional regulator